MGPDTVWVFIPITAIVLGITAGIIKEVLNSIERHAQMRLQRTQIMSAPVPDQQVQDLRTELAALRDTTTQFALSIDHTLKRIEQRIDHLERRVGEATVVEARPEQPVHQVIGR